MAGVPVAPTVERVGGRRHPLVDTLLLSGSVIVALGLARFAYALVLPSMRADLGLSFAAAGGLGTANTLGYLVGVVALPRLVRSLAPRTAVVGATIGTTASLLATPLLAAYPWLFAARFTAGILGAVANLVGLSLAAVLVSRHRSALVVFNSGVGVGVLLAGAALPLLLATDPERWRMAWVLLAGIGTLAALACSLARLDVPPPTPAPPDPTPLPWAPPDPTLATTTPAKPRATLHWLTGAYLCFGSGYIVYLTYLVVTLDQRHSPAGLVAVSFGLLGLACIVGLPLWARVERSREPAVALAISLAIQGVAALLLLRSGTPFVLASVILFGGSFMACPTFTMATIRALRAPACWTTTISRVTIPFAVAQAVAPWLSGAGIDHFGTAFAPTWTALCCLTATALAALQARAAHRFRTGPDRRGPVRRAGPYAPDRPCGPVRTRSG